MKDSIYEPLGGGIYPDYYTVDLLITLQSKVMHLCILIIVI